MPEPIRFSFDPVCPWTHQTARWARQLQRLGVVDVTWGLFSLELVNDPDSDPLADAHAAGRRALRTCALVRQEAGNDGLGRFYAVLGEALNERKQDARDQAVVASALRAAGLDEALAATAAGDPATWEQVVAEHHALVEQVGAFGVPVITLDGGTGPAIFGPVISVLPSDDDAVELWRHVSWLVRYESFSELKRDRAVRLTW